MPKKKLIEVALPLDDINREAAREKSIRHGHPSTLHLWWARRPLAACRAVLFASLVDDPLAHPDRFPTEEDQTAERERLFDIIRELVKWESSNDEKVLAGARAEIWASCDGNPPPVLDPFAGGGSIPLEAQRLGLEAHASDLNPVAVLINKALIEVPPRFAGQPPVHPDQEGAAELKTWRGAQGLAEDVRYYGRWMRDEAERRIGHLYPKVKLPKEHSGGEATVIAWIWARTVQSPNPAWNGQVPLVRSFALSTKKGKETWVEPIVDHETQTVRYEVRRGQGRPPEGTVGRQGGRCLATGSLIPFDYIRAEARAGRLGQQLMTIVAEGKRSRIYLAPTDEHAEIAHGARPVDMPSAPLPEQALGFRVQAYGMKTWGQLFTDRQLVALTTFSDLVAEARDRVRHDAAAADLLDDPTPLRDGGRGPTAYAEAVSVYLGFMVDKTADRSSTIATWDSTVKFEGLRNTFGRQAIPMTWDYAEGNPFSESSGSIEQTLDWISRVMGALPTGRLDSTAEQLDATALAVSDFLVSTDPPYYDNVPYADLSDFFYLWLRRSLAPVYPDEFSTLLVPKTQELVADPFRYGGKKESEQHFEAGLAETFERMRAAQDPRFPLTVYYAFKQAETSDGVTASTGWEVMLQSLLDSGFLIDGTWPMRSELANRMRGQNSNALASSIVLVCRHRPADAALATRKEFVAALKAELPEAVRILQHGNIAPVDLAQASLGPGMKVFSQFSKVVEADGKPMPVRTALELINQVLDETTAGIVADFDAETRWATTWFEENGMNEGRYGQAEQLSKSRNTSVDRLERAGIIAQRPEWVSLRPRDQLDDSWDPTTDRRLTVWEITQHLIRRLDLGGEGASADLLRQVGLGLGDTAKELAYRLYLVCDRKGWAKEALAYNTLVTVWPELTRRVHAPRDPAAANEQPTML
jgi:putative DNA methylase